jgi:hypothetical protein
MKKNILFVILLIIITSQAHSQKLKDVIYLKNGSIINGTLVEITDNQYKIKTSDGSLFIFKADEVEKYAKEIPAYEGRKKAGLGLVLEGGFMIGSQSSEYPTPFSFNFLGTYTLGTTNIFGLGSGVEFLGKNYTPIFFEYKRILNSKKISPFIFFRGGGLLYFGADDESNNNYQQYSVQTKYKGGPSFTAGTGISWAGENMETYLSFAYRYAATSYTEINWDGQETTYKILYNRLEIKFGFKF